MWCKLLIIVLTTNLAFTPLFAEDTMIILPEPKLDGQFSLEKTLAERRSTREFSSENVTLSDLAQILWACQGINNTNGFRTAPSAGALYPLEVYLVAKRVSGLEPGIYHYRPGPGVRDHSLLEKRSGLFLDDLANAALGQGCIRNCAFCIVICAVFERTSVKYGDRTERYVYMEAGHAAQNACLQAVALDLGIVTVGAFYDDKVKSLLNVSAAPIYFLPVGRKTR